MRRRTLARKTLPPSRRASVSASLRRDRAEARGEGGKAPLSPRCRAVAAGRRDGGPPRYLGAYGCWRIAGTWEAGKVAPEAGALGRKAVIGAFEYGYTLFDLADVYCDGVCESIFGQALKEVSGMRKRVLIATKCGIRKRGDANPHSPYRYDFSGEHIVRSCEQSLKRLGVETIDLYQLHRPDYLCDPAEVGEAFSQLRKTGKAREFGVSNF